MPLLGVTDLTQALFAATGIPAPSPQVIRHLVAIGSLPCTKERGRYKFRDDDVPSIAVIVEAHLRRNRSRATMARHAENTQQFIAAF